MVPSYWIAFLKTIVIHNICMKFIFLTISFNLLNFLNGIIHLPNLELSIIMITCSWSANSMEPGHIAWKCRLAWLYTGGKG